MKELLFLGGSAQVSEIKEEVLTLFGNQDVDIKILPGCLLVDRVTVTLTHKT